MELRENIETSANIVSSWPGTSECESSVLMLCQVESASNTIIQQSAQLSHGLKHSYYPIGFLNILLVFIHSDKHLFLKSSEHVYMLKDQVYVVS
jgi:hypothetical protein